MPEDLSLSHCYSFEKTFFKVSAQIFVSILPDIIVVLSLSQFVICTNVALFANQNLVIFFVCILLLKKFLIAKVMLKNIIELTTQNHCNISLDGNFCHFAVR